MMNERIICDICRIDIEEDEVVQCRCEAEICDDCQIECIECEEKGCKRCMLYDYEIGEWFCDNAGPDDCQKPRAERLLVSDCRDAYLKDVRRL